jgi:hypothetical protein
MHRPTLSRTERSTRTRSRSTPGAGPLENWLSWYWTSGHRTRRCPGLSGWRTRPRWRLVHRTWASVGHDHTRRRCLRARRCNGRRRFRGHWSRRLWRRDWRSCHRRRSRSLRRGRRRSGRMGRLRRRWLRDTRHWRLGNRRRWSRKCGSRRELRNDDPRRRNRRWRWWRRFHGRDRWRRWRSAHRRMNSGRGYTHRSLLLANGIQNVARP